LNAHLSLEAEDRTLSYEEKINKLVGFLYGKEKRDSITAKILALIETYKIEKQEKQELFTEQDVFLITYGDSLKRESGPPLSTLHHFAKTALKDIISTIHILPCFPYSSDDGFSVIDYSEINPELGTWEEVRALASDFKLMLDLVLNHISARSPWFKKYLAGEEGFQDLAIEVDPDTDLSMVTRPRALPLLTPFRKDNGQTVHLWTTFSADQVDLNFESADVLLKMLEVLLLYARHGGSVVRLDAIAYLWKEIGTTCIHLPQTHAAVKLLRLVFNAVRSDGIIITETNVPHPENISYFGSGHDEAQMVYNFTLPPLLLYTFIKEDTAILNQWARTLTTPSQETTFFNFTASHDGIGVRPLEGLILPEDLEIMVEKVKQNNGRVSYKRNPDGSESPYELNITYVDAFKKKDAHGLDPLHAKRFLASQAIQMVFPGVPAVYIHSLLGARNWLEGVEQTGRARTINREKLDFDTVVEALRDEHSFRYRVFTGYTRLLKVRRCQPAFHPNASFEIPDVDPRVFLMIRRTKEQTIYAFSNVSAQHLGIGLEDRPLTDLLTGKQLQNDTLELGPYDVVWLAAREV
jgi:sucrose phosphorylase